MNAKTVFVVGAGASKEFGLPLGGELKSQIAEVLQFKNDNGLLQINNTMHDAYRISVHPNGDVRTILKAARIVADAMPQSISIDNFIDAHFGNAEIELCGKLAIAKCIIDAESKSSIYVDESMGKKITFSNIPDNWLNKFLQLVTENCRLDGLKERLSRVAFVVFNYDRCIEHYLYYAFQNYYAISADDAAALVKCITIYHPYGTVGQLRWQEPAQGVGFGAEVPSHELLRLAGALKTFTEGVDSGDVETLRAEMLLAKKIVFLGFAYHRQNLELLFDKERIVRRSTEVFGTSLGISINDEKLIESELKEFMGGTAKVELQAFTCVNLFSGFWRSLSLSR